MINVPNEDQVNIFKNVLSERRRQYTIHPYFPQHSGDRLTILAEEVGEIAKAIQDKDDQNLRDELVQVAAVCFRWIEQLDKN